MAFARKVWKLLVAVKDGLALLFLLLFFAAIYAALSMRPDAGAVADGALLIELDGFVVEQASAPDPIKTLISRQAPVAEYESREIVRALRLAARDDRIKVVVMDLSRFLGGGQVHMQDIGEALDAVRAAGKPVMTWANFYGDDAMLLAAHASQRWVDPIGGGFIAGPGGTFLFYKDLMDRFAVTPHVYRVGRYKSAVEPYERTDLSEDARSTMQATLDALWLEYGKDVKAAKPGLELAQVTGDPVAWVNRADGNLAHAAIAAGMLDKAGSRASFDLAVAEVAGKREADSTGRGEDLPFAHTRLADWLAANPVVEEGDAIGVITVAGDIVDGEGSSGSAGGDRIARLLDDNLDSGLKALVVRVDSPGGSTMASEQIRLSLERYRAKKIPVVISMANMAASGGYWISTAGDEIFAEPATITGSIGVFAVAMSFEDTLAKFGVTTDGLRTTPLSGQPDVFGGFSPEVDAIFQASIANTYDHFLAIVSKARGLSRQQVDAEAQGRSWDGRAALRLKLVDRMGGLDEALAFAAKAANLGNGKYHARYLREPDSGWMSVLFGSSAVSSSGLTRIGGARPVAKDLTGWVAQQRDVTLGRALDRTRTLLSARSSQAFCLECPALPGPAPVDADRDGLVRTLLQISQP